eukprot:scpid112497/ scgid9720/ 
MCSQWYSSEADSSSFAARKKNAMENIHKQTMEITNCNCLLPCQHSPSYRVNDASRKSNKSHLAISDIISNPLPKKVNHPGGERQCINFLIATLNRMTVSSPLLSQRS